MAAMQRLMFVVLAGIAIALSASPASAQDERKFGVVVAYPGSVGLEWQAARKVAIRLDGDYRQTSSEGTSEFEFSRFVPALSITTTVESRNTEFGVSLLFDLHRSDALRLYVAPRIAVNFDHSSFKTEFDGDPALLAAVTVPADSDSSSTSPSGGVAVGASHDVSDRFRVFGETGVHYVRGTFGGLIGDDLENSAFGLRAGVGAVIRF
jgi:opacity protein-like surface antigen